MRKVLLLVCVLCVGVSFLNADRFGKFRDEIAARTETEKEKLLNVFCEDIAAAIAQTSFHQAGTLAGTLPGFDIGLHTGYKNIHKENTILKAADVNAILLPLAQMEIGIPGIDLDLILRYTALDKSSLLGGGFRYGILKTIPFDLTALLLYNKLSAGDNKFGATVITGSVGLNFNVHVISPYLALRVDSAELIPDISITTQKGKATLTRIDAGVNLGLLPFTYLNLGGAYIIASESSMAYRAGLGVKF